MFFKNLFFYSFLSMAILFSLTGKAIEVGKSAPSLKVAKWLKNEPKAYLNNLKEGKNKDILVLCFWATWSDTSDNIFSFLNTECDIYNKENVVFVAMSKENERIVERFVRANKNISFSVAADKKSETYDDFMEGAKGVPMFFIIGKDGDLVWKGGPFEVDRVLSRVITGTYDNDKEKQIEKIREQLQESIQYINFEQQAEYAERILKLDPVDVSSINILVDSYIRKDQLDKAIKYLSEKIKEANFNKFITRTLYFSLLTILQGMDNKDGVKYLKEAVETYYVAFQNNPEALNSYAVAVVQGMPMDIVPLQEVFNLVNKAIEVQKEVNPNDNHQLGLLYRSFAKIYYLGGKTEQAIEYQKTSLDYLKKAEDNDLIDQADLLLSYYQAAENFGKNIK